MEFLANIFLAVIRIYIMLIVVRIFLSWLNLPYNKWIIYLEKITDPVLNYFKRIFPIKIGFLDLSPLVPLLILGLADNIITDLMLNNVNFGVAYTIGIVLYIIKFAFNVFLSFFGFSVVLLFLFSFIMPHSYNPIITMLRSFLDPILSKLRRVIRIHSFYSDRIYLAILFILVVIISVSGNYLLDFIKFNLVGRLRF